MTNLICNFDGFFGTFNDILEINNKDTLSILRMILKKKSDKKNIKDFFKNINYEKLSSKEIKSLSIINCGNECVLDLELLNLLFIFLSFTPYNIENIVIDLTNIDPNLMRSDPEYQKFCNDLGFRFAHFLSKNINSCKNLIIETNYLIDKCIDELSKYYQLESIKLNIITCTLKLINCFIKIIQNNPNLNHISFEITGINSKVNDFLWILIICSNLNNLKKLKHINIIWSIDHDDLNIIEINDENFNNLFTTNPNLVFNNFIEKYHLNECKNILRELNLEFVNIEINCFKSIYANLFTNFFNDVNTLKNKNKRIFDSIEKLIK